MDYRVIKENDLFLTTNPNGDIPHINPTGLGLYAKDTRYLSRMEFRINGKLPVLLTSQADENFLMTFLLTNVPDEEGEKLALWRESIELKRRRFIHDGVLYESVTFTNYYPKEIEFEFSGQFDADFNDMFIVRGFLGGKVGSRREPTYELGKLTLNYDSADGVARETRIQWDSTESRYDEAGIVHFNLKLAPREVKTISFFIAPFHKDEGTSPLPLDEARHLLEQSYASWNEETTRLTSDSSNLNKLYHKGIQDMRVLLTDLGFGTFPVAGLPWYAVPFGRDSLIAALQMLAVNPQVARGTLLTMAHYQATKVEEWRDEQPGKIMHEIRYGELANTNQIPFTPYFGSVDATPLFLLLLAEYYHWTEDILLVKQLMPQLEKALEWIDTYGDEDKDSFVEYYLKSSKGIANQGWKDSADSIVHEDGSYAKAPIALVEVQGYVYQAKTKLAPILRLLDKAALAEKLELEAAQMKESFEAAFWMEDHKFYAIALDENKKQVRSITSNPGHALMSGLMDPSRAAHVAKRLVAKDMFSGYGIRTMSDQSAGYNPMSYHDGSIWPHDNSMCLLGLSSYGFHEEANQVIEGLMKSVEGFEHYRLPELFCGYSADQGMPVPYPVACSPQAWAAGTPLVFMQVMLGIKPDAINKRIELNPSLPNGINELTVENLFVAQGRLSLSIKRQANGALAIDIIANTTGYLIESVQSTAVLNN